MNTNSIPNVDLSELGLNAPVSADKKEESDSTDFLELFVAQLKNQNPLEPQDGSEFLAQLAQFSTVEGIKNMESSMNSMVSALSSSQTLQATSLVGKQVEVKTGVASLQSGQNVKGSVEVPSNTSNVVLEIKNLQGEVVRTYEYNEQASGDVGFIWDGLDQNGDAVSSGAYQLTARGSIAGQETQLDTYVATSVDSVSINKNGEPIIVNVNGFGQVSLNDIKSIS
tara:strand:+ start:72954 stop:73628 length:675 start_codon:yes stop_codon:yes gene_type:complete